MPRVQHKRGLKANLPSASLLAGEFFITTDRQTAHFALDATNMKPLVPAIDDLATLASVDGAADLIIVHDASQSGVKEKKMTVDAFKAALNIPEGTTDEKVAIVSGGTAGYVWGTNGTDGVIRVNSSLTWSKDAGNGFVTFGVGDVDCGTF